MLSTAGDCTEHHGRAETDRLTTVSIQALFTAGCWAQPNRKALLLPGRWARPHIYTYCAKAGFHIHIRGLCHRRFSYIKGVDATTLLDRVGQWLQSAFSVCPHRRQRSVIPLPLEQALQHAAKDNGVLELSRLQQACFAFSRSPVLDSAKKDNFNRACWEEERDKGLLRLDTHYQAQQRGLFREIPHEDLRREASRQLLFSVLDRAHAQAVRGEPVTEPYEQAELDLFLLLPERARRINEQEFHERRRQRLQWEEEDRLQRAREQETERAIELGYNPHSWPDVYDDSD